MNTQFVANEPNAFRADGGLQNPTGRNPVSIRCPHCRELGSFNVVNQAVSFTKRGKQGPNYVVHQWFASIRICPNIKCFGLVLVIGAHDGRMIQIQPPQLLDFSLRLATQVTGDAKGVYRSPAWPAAARTNSARQSRIESAVRGSSPAAERTCCLGSREQKQENRPE